MRTPAPLPCISFSCSPHAGYAHDYNPDNAPGSEQRCMALLTEPEKALPAWTEYVRSLQVRGWCSRSVR